MPLFWKSYLTTEIYKVHKTLFVCATYDFIVHRSTMFQSVKIHNILSLMRILEKPSPNWNQTLGPITNKWHKMTGNLTHLPLVKHFCINELDQHWQITACCLFGAKPLPEPMLTYYDFGSLGTNISEIRIKIQNFLSTKILLETVTCEMAAILSMERWVNSLA